MQVAVERSDLMLTAISLGRVAFDYIPHHYLKNLNKLAVATSFKSFEFVANDGEEQLQVLLDNSNNELRMYGSAKELAENLKIYRAFSWSHKKFEMNIVEPFNILPTHFRSLNDEEYICKLDLFVYLQTFILSEHKAMQNPVPRGIIMIFLKTQQERLKDCCEFVKYDEAIFNDIRKQIKEILKNATADPDKYILDKRANTFEKILKEFQKLLPEWNEKEYEEMTKALRATCNQFSPKKFHEIYDGFYIFTKCTLEVLKKIMGQRPEMFLPYTDKNRKNAPIVVRLFEDGPEKFVMTSEIKKAMNTINPETKTNDKDEKDEIWKTTSYVTASLSFGKDLDKVEFIRYPIKRAKHAAVPIVTPSGDLCILATDALLQILRRLIFGMKVFQRIKNNMWPIVFGYIMLLEKQLEVDEKSKYFINLNIINAIEERIEEYWRQSIIIDDQPAKYVRNAKKDGGFTVENLKNELKHLGVTDIFPEITDYAEKVYDDVNRWKKEKVLRTCDLFDAIENCQLICFFNRFPNLKAFLHNQESCHRVPHLQFDKCSPKSLNENNENPDSYYIPPMQTFKLKVQPGPPKFTNTKWKEYSYSGSKIIIPNNPDLDPRYDCKMEFSDGNILTSNYALFPFRELKAEYSNFFILDKNDVALCLRKPKEKGSSKTDKTSFDGQVHLYSLDNYMKFNKTKRLYIRASPSTTIRKDEAKRLFTSEVLEMIPVILKQQNTPIELSDERLQKYQKKWKSDDNDIYNSIDIQEFRKVLEEFDVNKELITIAPDPVFEFSGREMVEKGGNHNMSLISPNGKVVMDTSQAVFHIFQSVVCGINWKKKICGKHKNCLEELRQDVINVMKEYMTMDEGVFVTIEHIEKKINDLKSHCSYTYRLKYAELFEQLDNSEYDEMIFYHLLYGMPAGSYELPLYSNFTVKSKSFLQDENLPVWMARLFLMAGWVYQFFDERNLDIVKLIVNALIFKIPMEMRENSVVFLKKVLNKTIDKDDVVLPESDATPSPDLECLTAEELQILLQVEERKKKELQNSIRDMEKQSNRMKKEIGINEQAIRNMEKNEKRKKMRMLKKKKKAVNKKKLEEDKEVTVMDSEENQLNSESVVSENEIKSLKSSSSVEKPLVTVMKSEKHPSNGPKDSENEKIIEEKEPLESIKNEDSVEKEAKKVKNESESLEYDEPKQQQLMKNVLKCCSNCDEPNTEIATIQLRNQSAEGVKQLLQIEEQKKELRNQLKEMERKKETIEEKIFSNEETIKQMEQNEKRKKNKKKAIKKADESLVTVNKKNSSNQTSENVEEKCNCSECCDDKDGQESDTEFDFESLTTEDWKLLQHVYEEKRKEDQQNAKRLIRDRLKHQKVLEKDMAVARIRMENMLKEMTEEDLKIVLKHYPEGSSDQKGILKMINSVRTKNPSQPKKSGETQKKEEDLSKKLNSIEKSNEPKEQQLMKNESKCCSKCLRTSELCIEAKKELKTTQNKLKIYEKKAKKTDELEKKIKENDKEIDVLKQKNLEVNDENECLKLKISKLEVHETEILKQNQKLNTSCDQLTENVIQLKNQLKSEEQKFQIVKQDSIHLKENAETDKKNNVFRQNQLQNEISAKDKSMKDLQSTIMRLSIQNEEHEKTIQTLLDRISSSSSSVPTTSSHFQSSPSENYGGVRYQLVWFQKLKDTFFKGNQLKQAKEMTEKLKSQTNRLEIQQLANYEMMNFERQIRNYLQIIEMNIQKIKSTGHCFNLSPLPEYPSFSDEFMREYKIAHEQQQSTSSSSEMTSELTDPECLICLQNMKSSDETLKCEHCRRRYHMVCASEWLKVKRMCPTCNSGLLTPTEFPSIS